MITLLASTLGAFAGVNTSLPFVDTFETYTNGTPLDTGTNGWYGSSSNIMVQTNIVRTGTNAAIIPVDGTLSNRFQDIVVTNVWIQMDLRPSLFDGTNTPVVDTNTTWLFYINSNGNFVVHNGPATNPSPTNSANWITNNNVQIPTNGTTWVRINIYENFSKTNWDLYADGVLVTNAIGFVNTNLTNFAGFELYNGVETSYLDNVSVTAMDTNNPIQRPLIVIPPTPSVRTLFVTDTPSLQTVKVCNVWSDPIGFEVATNRNWLAASPANGTVAAKTTTDVTLTYARMLDWQVGGSSNAIVTVVATNGTDSWDTQTVAVVINIMGYGSGTTNTIPFYDDFEYYANQTPLVNGINGWYGSSNGIIVQQSVVRGGLQAAMIPVDCTLSNPFVPADPTNVWIQMDLRPIPDNGTNYPTVNTNLAAMFYINSNGNFVVHNGVASPNPSNSVNWVTLPNGGIGTNGTTWVRIDIYEDFSKTNWNLYANGALITNAIGFINTSLTNFAGFDTYNGARTSYLDNVSVTAVDTNNPTQLPLIVSPPYLEQSIVYLATPAVQTVQVVNAWGSAIGFRVATNQAWVTADTAGGTVTAMTTQNVTLTYNTSGWPAGDTSNATVTVVATNGAGLEWSTQTVAVALTVGKATATVTLGNLSQTYDGLAKNVSTSTTPAGLPLVVTYNGNVWAPTNAGSYAVTGTVNDVNYQGTSIVTLVVDKAAATVTLGNLSQTYDGTARNVSTSTTPAGLPLDLTYNGNAWAPTNAGSYAVTGTVNDINYQGTANDTLVVNQANQTITFPAIAAQALASVSMTLSATASSALTVTFTNTSVLGSNIVGSTLTFNGAGEYTIMASQTGNVNYTAAATVSRTFPVYGSSPTTNTIPYTNNFEHYFNLEPLINGTNGWYGNSNAIIVQTNIVATGIYITATGGTNAAMIPEDCMLSNRFVAGTPLNARIEMDSRPVRFEGTNFPPVDTNAVALFYVDTNGHFVVCNWIGTTSAWCMVSNAVGSGSEFVVTNETWAHIVISLDYRHRQWKLKANNILITNNIKFVTQQTNGFSGFDVYSGLSSTSYLDNVSVNWWDRFKVNGVLDHLIRSVNGVIPDKILDVPTP